MPDQIATRQLGERRVTVDRAGRIKTLACQHVRMPPVDERAADGNAAQAGEHEEVHECLPGGWDARGVEASAELVTTQRTFFTQGALDQRDAALRVGCRDTGLSKPARVG